MKKLVPLQKLTGGINNFSNPRELTENDISSGNNIDITEPGIIKPVGTSVVHSAGPVVPTTDVASGAITRGFGLFAFSSDRVFTSVKVTMDDDATADISVGDIVGNDSDFTNSAAVGYVYAITTTYMVVSQYTAVVWGTSETIYIGQTYTDNSAVTSGHDTHAGTTPVAYTPETGEDYILCAHPSPTALNDALIGVYGSNAGWHDILDVGATAPYKPVFSNFDGVIRIVDGNFGSGNQPKWYGYIKRTHFGGDDEYDSWYLQNVELAKPTRGLGGNNEDGWTDTSGTYYMNAAGTADAISSTGTALYSATANGFIEVETEIADAISATEYYSAYNIDHDEAVDVTGVDGSVAYNYVTTDALAAGDGDWLGDEYAIIPPAGTGFTVVVGDGVGEGDWEELKQYEMATTFIYDGSQESALYMMRGYFYVNSASTAQLVQVYAQTPFAPRITGGRAYYRTYGSDEDWKLLVDIDLERGVRATIDGQWVRNEFERGNNWYNEDGTVYSAQTTSFIKNFDTYESINGFPQDADTTPFGEAGTGYLTAVVANRSLYVGNVTMRDEDDELIHRGDVMIKSPVNAPDVLLYGRRVEVEINDGDDITHLDYYGGNLLQFKKRKLYIIDITQPFERLVADPDYRGVAGSHAVCHIDGGIAFANRYGLFVYDGKTIHEISLNAKTGQRRFDWNAFIGSTSDYIAISYIPKTKQIQVVNDSLGSVIYTIASDSIVTTSGKFAPDYYTNTLNFTFDDGLEGWAEGTGVTLTNPSGDMDVAATSTNQYAYRAIDIVKGVEYEIEFDSDYASDPFYVFLGDSSASLAFGFAAKLSIEDSPKSATFTATSSGTGYLIIQATANGSNINMIGVTVAAYTVGTMTNHINDVDGNAVYGLQESGVMPAIYRFDTTNREHSTIEFITKDYELGAPDIRKQIYSLWTSHKNAYTALYAKTGAYYGIDGATPSTFIAWLATSAVNIDEELTIASVNNAKSIRFKFLSAGDASPTMEIGNLAVTARKKIDR